MYAIRSYYDEGKASANVSVPGVRFLFRFLSWTSQMYSQFPPEISDFDESLIPKVGFREKSLSEIQRLEKLHADQIGLANQERKKRLEIEEELKKIKAQQATTESRKQQNTPVPVPAEQYTEAETRDLIIDAIV